MCNKYHLEGSCEEEYLVIKIRVLGFFCDRYNIRLDTKISSCLWPVKQEQQQC